MSEQDRDIMCIIHENMRADADEIERADLGEALYGLFLKYRDSYESEWARMKENEKLYHGKHWESQKGGTSDNKPKPVTPILFSTIESIKADMIKELPSATIKPEYLRDDLLAKVLSKVVEQDLDASDFEAEYEKMCDDILVYGWCASETIFDGDAQQGNGLAEIRRVAPFCFMSDPASENLQDGRACFKFTQRTKEWFRQHYPDQCDRITYEVDIADKFNNDAEVKSNGSAQCQYLIEAWVKQYDAYTGKDNIHMAVLAGDVLLDLSTDVREDGYYSHGQYPFVITPLYPVAGTPFGLGIPDMHKATQLHSDKLDQILLMNAQLCSNPRMLVTEASGFDADDLKDWSKSVHVGESINGVTWFPTPQLPSWFMGYLQMMRGTIKSESGANEQSRGQTTGGVTAASAISALQEMATKRSSMHSIAMHTSFKKAVRMLLDVESDFGNVGREVIVMSNGASVRIALTKEQFKQIGVDGKPLEYHILIETARQTQYSVIATNELAIQLGNMFAGSVDPIDIIQMMDFKERDMAVERIIASRKGELVTLRKQNAEMQQTIEHLSEQNKQYRDAFAKVRGTSAAESYRQQAQQRPQQQSQGITDEQARAMLGSLPQ